MILKGPCEHAAKYNKGCLQACVELALPLSVWNSHSITMNHLILSIGLFVSISCAAPSRSFAETGHHLFILSGQSNMAGLKPAESFTPTVEKEFGNSRVIVVHDALGGQPIRRWYKKWKVTEGQKPSNIGDLYDRLMKKVIAATLNKEIQSVTFVWMQGERDAREKNAAVYGEALTGLHQQLSRDLERDDVGFVIGRLSDFDMQNKRYPHWTKIRDIQVKVAENHPRSAWVDTDDLNDGLNRRGKPIKDDLHYSADGYKTLGKRFADKAIQLIKTEK